MSTHRAKFIPESEERTNNGGVALTARCCDDPATETRVHVQHAGTMTRAELARYLTDALVEIEAAHAAHVAVIFSLPGLVAELNQR